MQSAGKTGQDSKMQIDETEFEDDLSSSAYYGDGWQIVGHTCSRYFGPEWRAEQDEDMGIELPRGLYGRNGKLAQIMTMVSQGIGTREIMRIAHSSGRTVKRCRDILQRVMGKTFACKCGKQAAHRGHCPASPYVDRVVPGRSLKPQIRSRLNLDHYSDIPRLQFLITLSSRQYYKQLCFSDEVRKAFLHKFYHDRVFIKIYSTWKASGKSQHYPSLARMDNKNGFELGNLHFLSRFEKQMRCYSTD